MLSGSVAPRGGPHLACPVPPNTSWGWLRAHLRTRGEILGGTLKAVIRRSLQAE